MATKYNFSDIFVSYAHSDRDVVKPITDELARRDYEIWVDWEDIPQTANWWQEIEAGIDASNTFVFFVSPHSAQSEVCYREVQYAVDNNKRIVPVMCIPIENNEIVEKLHPAIRIHNWLLFHDEQAFEENIQRLITTLTTELGHLRLHTRYLVRAREWDERERAISFLLRGTDAEEAISWLQTSYAQEPKPLTLHQAYIQACQQQLQIDTQLGIQQRALLFVERRTFPAFFAGLFVIFYYMWQVYPDETLTGLSRLQLIFGISAVFGGLLAAISLYADELVSIRFPDNFYLRFIGSLVFSILFSMITLGILQALFNDIRVDYVILFLGWLGYGMSYFLDAIFKLKGWQAFLIGFVGNSIIIYFLSATADAPWTNGYLPIFYFETSSQHLFIGLLMAIMFPLGGHAWAIFQDILSLLPEYLRENKTIQSLVD